ncbi:MAG: site-specific integrase, partial [Pseudomonadota bacterium]|nr:site-specific integrase [Pseudomonadota bacterium]
MPRLTQEEAKKVIKQYFSDAMRCLEQQMDVVDDYSGFLASVSATPSLIDFTDDRKRLDFLYPNEFYDNKGEPALGIEDNHTPDAPRIISFLANKHHIDAPQGTYSYEVLKTGVQRAIAELLNIHGQYVNYDTDIQIADDMFKEASSSLKVIENNGDPISEIFEKYLNECKRNDEGTHSLDSKRSCYALWNEIFEDHPINGLSPEKARKFKEILLKLPKNKSKHYPDKTITELLDMQIKDSERMSTSTINGYIMQLSSFSKWAIDNHHLNLSKNPFEGLRLKRKKKAVDARHPFSANQLKIMFSTPMYKGCERDTKHGRFIAGDLILKDAYYWIPLLALYTGARMSELLQLTINDVKQEQGIWFLDINDEGTDKNLKTTQSKRRIPIHSALIDLGIIDYKNEIEAAGKSRLFHEIEPYKGDYSHRYSKWFSRYLDRYEIKTGKTSFHSFRHSF